LFGLDFSAASQLHFLAKTKLDFILAQASDRRLHRSKHQAPEVAWRLLVDPMLKENAGAEVVARTVERRCQELA
jgi:hypothetical protein